jgi:RNA polymerase sigma factor (sigma-70 family)
LESPPITGKGWVLTPEAFAALLDWLDPDTDQAAKRYEEIRRRLIKFFTHRKCIAAADLADETFNRVARKIQEGLKRTSNDSSAPYFYAVAHNIYLEHVRTKPATLPMPSPRSADEVELEHACLDQCMERLSPRSRDLISEFYQEEKQAKIEHRKRLAERFGITPNALRIQAHRIRLVLHECLRQCLGQHELL